MKKMNTTPISGTLELLPPEQAVFNQLKKQIEVAYHRHGFQFIEPPTIDRNEILFAKAGGDTEKQIYRVIKTTESAEDSDQSLRFDHTVPLARYVVEHESSLVFPLRVAQIGKNFRGERAQKGRFREFYQCDVDVVGRNDLPLAYDAEVIATLYDALKSCLKAPMLVRVSNRKILSGLIKMLEVEEKANGLFSIVDHAEKVSPEKTRQALYEELADDDLIDFFLEFILTRGNFDDAKSRLEKIFEEIKNFIPPENQELESFQAGQAEFEAGLEELETVLNLLQSRDLGENVIADMLIVRGLDYYTGTVFETFLPDYPEIGSVCSGGRYENLAGNYTDQSFPGVGGSIGLSRLYYVLSENGLLPENRRSLIDYAIVPISKDEYPLAFQLAETIGSTGDSVDVVLTDKRLGDKLTYASKLARFAVVIGEEERKTGQLKIKDFTTGQERPLNIEPQA